MIRLLRVRQKNFPLSEIGAAKQHQYWHLSDHVTDQAITENGMWLESFGIGMLATREKCAMGNSRGFTVITLYSLGCSQF
jgi:hypothetical protein